MGRHNIKKNQSQLNAQNSASLIDFFWGQAEEVESAIVVDALLKLGYHGGFFRTEIIMSAKMDELHTFRLN